MVGWPPIRSFRKNTMASNLVKNNDAAEGKSGSGCLYVKVSMDGAPYLRKVDLKIYSNYMELSSALEKMFSCFTIGILSSSFSHIYVFVSSHTQIKSQSVLKQYLRCWISVSQSKSIAF